MERVFIRAAELVDVHTGRSAHAAVVADEHVKVLPGNTAELGNEVLHSPQLQQGSVTGQQSLPFPARRWEPKEQQTWLMEQLWEKPGVVRRTISPGHS